LADFSFSKAASKLAIDWEAGTATAEASSEVGVDEFTKIAKERQKDNPP
jgi:hypothetical protein